MFGFNFPRGIAERDRNLPRFRVTELARSQQNSGIVSEYRAEMLFIDKYHDVDNSAVSLLGLRCQRLFWHAEVSLTMLLNYLRRSYVRPGRSVGLVLFVIILRFICS